MTSITPHPFDTFLARYTAAVWARDVEALVALYAPGVQVYDTWQAWRHDGQAAWRDVATEWLAGLGEGQRVRVQAEVQQRHQSGDLATGCAVLRFSAVGPDDRVLRWLDNRLTVVLARRPADPSGLPAAPTAADWWVVHEHTSAPLGDDAKGMLQRPG